MTTLKACMALVLAACAMGCQSGSAPFETVRMPGGDYDRTFEITRQVLAEQFTIAKADKSTGRIEAVPQGIADTGDKIAGATVMLETARGMRRVATANVKPGTTVVSVKVQLETAREVQPIPRPAYDESEATTGGGQGEYYNGPEKKGAVMWSPSGSDEVMEKKLLAEIENRLKAAGTEAEPTPEKPETSK